jgi:hypothetical protein
MRIRDVQFCRFRASFCKNQAEFRTSKIPLNIFADGALTTALRAALPTAQALCEFTLQFQLLIL